MTTPSASAFKASTWLRTRRHRFHLDMTPMVGLAFLLLTFFLLHAGVAKPRVLPLTMPLLHDVKKGIYCSIRADYMTIIIGNGHKLHYFYERDYPLGSAMPFPKLRTTDFSSQGIRKVLLARRAQLPEPVILIKPALGATYKDMIDILDEMNITAQKKYALIKLTAADRQLLLANGRQ